MNTTCWTALLLSAAVGALAAEEQIAPAPRAGGLLACEELPGEAVMMRRPDPFVVPRADGGLTALFFYGFPAEAKRPVEVLYADLATGKTRVESLPAGIGTPWVNMWGPDGRLYYGLWGPATLLRYDPGTDKVDNFGDIEPDGNSVPILTIGADEKIYALCSPAAHVFSLDPANDQIVHYGAQGPKRNYGIAYRGSIGVDDEYIYTTFGNIPNETFTVAMNKKTREQTLLADLQGASISQGRLGVTAVHQGKTYWLYQGKAVLKQAADEKPPWPEREPAPRKDAPKPAAQAEFLQNSVIADPDGNTKVWYRLGAKEPWRALEYRVKSEPMLLRECRALPDGRVFSSTAYHGLFTVDPKTGAFRHEGIAPISHYSTQIVGGKAYLANYPGGNSFFVWDPALPWTVNRSTPDAAAPPMTDAKSNPQQLPMLAGIPGAPGGFQHPWFTALAKDKTLFAAVHGERHNVGSLVVWRELESGKSGFLREPFELYDPAGMCSALDGAKIVYSTTAIKGIKGEPKPSAGRLFVIDASTRQVEWSLDPLPGVESAGLVVETRPGELLVAAPVTAGRADAPKDQPGVSALYKIDLNAPKVTRRVEVPGLLAGRRTYYWLIDLLKGPDGMIYTLHDDTLVRIDPETLAITVLSRIDKPGRIAFSGDDIYLSGTSHFRRVRNALKP